MSTHKKIQQVVPGVSVAVWVCGCVVSGVRLCQRTFIISFCYDDALAEYGARSRGGLCDAYYATEIEKLCLPARWG